MKQLHYTLQTLIRGRGAVVVKLVSLTLGLLVGVLLFAQIAYELSFDRFYPDPETLVTLRMRNVTKGVPEAEYNYGTYRPAAADLSEAMPELVESASLAVNFWQPTLYLEDKKLDAFPVIFADTAYFHTTGLQVLRGDATEPVATPVKWERYFGADQPAGEVTVNGTLTELNNVQVSFTVTVYPKSTVLFMDAGSSADNESEYYEAIRRNAPDLINDKVSDQPYSEGGWGYSSTVAPDGDMQLYGTDSNDIYETGWYANTGKTIEYKADLASGTYTVTAGFKDWWAEWNDRTVHFVVSDTARMQRTSPRTPLCAPTC